MNDQATGESCGIDQVLRLRKSCWNGGRRATRCLVDPEVRMMFPMFGPLVHKPPLLFGINHHRKADWGWFMNRSTTSWNSAIPLGHDVMSFCGTGVSRNGVAKNLTTCNGLVDIRLWTSPLDLYTSYILHHSISMWNLIVPHISFLTSLTNGHHRLQ